MAPGGADQLGAADAALLGSHRPAQPAPALLCDGAGGGGARRGGSGRCEARARRVARAAARRSLWPQGHPGHGGGGDELGGGDAPGAGARPGLVRGGGAAPGGGGAAGEDERGGAGLRRPLARRADAQSVEPGGRVERVERRVGVGGGGGAGRVRHRDGDAGLHRSTLRALRHGGAAPDLRARVAAGGDALVLVARQDRDHRARGGGHPPGAGRAERARPGGPVPDRVAAARL